MEKMVNREVEFQNCSRKYTPMIQSIITKWRLGREADEYFQIGLVALYEAWVKYDRTVGEFAPYAYSYITGRIKNEIARNDQWQRHHSLVEPCEAGDGVMSPMVESEEDLVDLMAWLDQVPLTEKERLWAEAAVFYRLKPGEIADMYGYNVHTVKSWRQSAVRKLRGACHHPEIVEGSNGKVSNVSVIF